MHAVTGRGGPREGWQRVHALHVMRAKICITREKRLEDPLAA